MSFALLAVLALSACTGSEPEPAAPEPPPEPVIHVDRTDGAWGEDGAGGGCEHLGVRTLEARFVVDPAPADNHFGKAFQGEWLVLPDGTRWVVSYRPRPEFARFAGQDVVVRGWPCNRRGEQSISAPHFDIERIALREGLPDDAF